MTDRNTDDIYEELTAAERKGRRKQVLPKRLLRLIVLLAAIVILVVVIVVVATSASGSGETADYQRYMTSVTQMLDRSDAIGSQVVNMLTKPGDDTTRKEIQTRLDQAISTSQQLEAQAGAMMVPKELAEQDVHQFLVLVLHFRYQGLADLKLSLMNALEVKDVDVSAEQITRALTYLTNSDFLYNEVFVSRTTEILTAKELDGITVPDTKFLKDPDLASKSRVQEVLAVLKSTGNLQAVHGVAVSKVVASPDDKTIDGGGTYNLTSSDELAFLVSVENQGNMAEKEVPVVVTLLAPDSTTPQKVTVTIPELKPKEELTVTVTGLNPTTYGEEALLRVEAGPVKDEKFKDNNWIEANLIFTL